jgi:hypothetical protein
LIKEHKQIAFPRETFMNSLIKIHSEQGIGSS